MAWAIKTWSIQITYWQGFDQESSGVQPKGNPLMDGQDKINVHNDHQNEPVA